MPEADVAKPTYDVVVAGSYFCDMVYTGLPDMPRLGADVYSKRFDMVPGGTYYIVRILHRLGLKTGWICDFGNDFFSRFMLDQIRGDGIDISLSRMYDRPKRVVASSFSFKQDRGFVSYEDEPFVPPTFEELEGLNFRSILFPGIGDWKMTDVVERLSNRRNMVVYMDCQCAPQTIHTPGMREALGKLDIFAPNESEALHFTGESDIDRALDVLADLVPLVVLKRGGKGSLARRGNQVWEVPGIQVEVVDTTGAGDSYNAGFLYAYLRGHPMETCLKYGNVTGGLSVTAPGPLQCPDMNLIHEMVEHYDRYQSR
jgi:sugar/nucleoside kinase (ribokinase family)